ncbi:MAG: hypothetical protein LBQ51_07600, partial [Desulfovibrio sp.]|nr:hypothetical protein [Desulfovibrio sp.]
MLALTNDDKEAIAEFETFGDSLCHIIRNRAEYERGLAVFGFTAININEHGWLQRPVFMDCKEIDFPLKAHVIGRNSIIIGRSQNNKWTYGLYLAASKSGSASGLSIYADPYSARNVTAHRVSVLDKGDIRAFPLEETLEGVYKHRIGALFLDAA